MRRLVVGHLEPPKDGGALPDPGYQGEVEVVHGAPGGLGEGKVWRRIQRMKPFLARGILARE